MRNIQWTKTSLILFICAIILLLIVFAIAFLSFFPPSSKEPPVPSISPASPAPLYNKKSQDLLLEKVTNRAPLTNKEISVKKNILSNLPSGKTSGILYQTNNIIIDYTSGIDLFQVEILTTDIVKAKDEAVSWFLSQGATNNNLCNYPVQFYLNYDIANKLIDLRKENNFSSLAPGCQ